MHPRAYAGRSPLKAAYIMAETGAVITYRELENDANRIARLIKSLGLNRGDVMAVLLENHNAYFKLVWAAQRVGVYVTCISTKLVAGEIDYILMNSRARMLVSSPALVSLLADMATRHPMLRLFMVGDAIEPFESLDKAIRDLSPTPVDQECPGGLMLYSSGTTGRPKGIKPPLPPSDTPLLGPSPESELAARLFDFSENSIYLSPAPLYHAAPLHTCMLIQRLGATVVVMPKFDAEFALALIEKYHVTASQWVPTHFVRMLKLPADIRGKYDLSSMKIAIHAAAPCPIEIKQAMIDWWGPILVEYYGGTEGIGSTFIRSVEWLSHKGSVGRAAMNCQVWICDDHGEPLPTGSEGLVYFSGGRNFTYHDDPAKTSASRNHRGWSTMGDVGVLDAEGYLYLRDRKDFMIITGGVNVYPQEVENLLLTHPGVMDAAVFGIPDDEMGQKVVAVIQVLDGLSGSEALALEIQAFARERLSHIKVPRIIEFQSELPRSATGKLMKRSLREAFLNRRAHRSVQTGRAS